MSWEVLLHADVEQWFLALCQEDPDTAEQVAAAIDVLAEDGPTLGRPLVDRVKLTAPQHEGAAPGFHRRQ